MVDLHRNGTLKAILPWPDILTCRTIEPYSSFAELSWPQVPIATLNGVEAPVTTWTACRRTLQSSLSKPRPKVHMLRDQ